MLAGIMTFANGQNSLPLDVYNTSPIGAYSLRKLRTNYTGNAIRIRRASDNTETNIGFTSTGELNTSAIATFCSGTTGSITTMYDQSGAGNNAVQTTAALQPIIYSGGAVITQNGKPAFSVSNGQGLVIAKTTTVAISTYVVLTNSESPADWALWQNGTNQYAIVAGSADSGIIYSQATAPVTHWVNGAVADMSTRLRVSNALPQNVPKLLTQMNWTPSSTWGASIQIFTYPIAPSTYTGYGQEIIMFYNDVTPYRIEMEANIREYYRLW